MGTGRDLGLQVRGWLEAGVLDLDNGTALANRLIDGLGAEVWLSGPVRDLAAQPLLRQVLRQRGGAQRSALESLRQQLERTYAPRVLAELLELLEAASGLPLGLVAPEALPVDQPTPVAQTTARGQGSQGHAPPVPGPGSPHGPTAPEAEFGDLGLAVTEPPLGDSLAVAGPRGGLKAPRPTALTGPADLRALARQLQPLGPGLALAFALALVWWWAALELDRRLFDGWGWSGGVALVLVLGLLQALALGPLKATRRQWPLEQADASNPHGAWRWLTAPWIHHDQREAVVNLLMLLVLLGPSPLPLADVVLRYGLTSLATLALALLVAQRRTPEGRWDGASGAISALIGLGTAASLLHWRALDYPIGRLGFGIPAWVLLVLYGALQLAWVLPRRSAQDDSRPLDRLLSSQWWWGLVLGVGWALVSRGGELLQAAARARATAPM